MTIKTAIPILGILITTLVAIYSIRKIAAANRVSIVHNEMTQCIIDSIIKIRKINALLDGISKKISYYRLPNYELIESAYDRYWREIQTISAEFNPIQSRQMFVFPKILYEKMQNLINKINEGRHEAKNYNPKTDIFAPGNNKLKDIVKEIDSIYVDFVNEARQHVGVGMLKRISIKNEKILKVEETKKL